MSSCNSGRSLPSFRRVLLDLILPPLGYPAYPASAERKPKKGKGCHLNPQLAATLVPPAMEQELQAPEPLTR